MERNHFAPVELAIASAATKGPPGEELDEFGGQNIAGLAPR